MAAEIVRSEGEPGEGLSDRQRRALRAILECPTFKAAAEQARVSPRTLRRYLHDPDFAAALAEEQRRLLRFGMMRAGSLLERALDVVSLDMEPGARADMRLRAAALVLQHVTRLLEFFDLEERIARLEERADREKA